MARFVTLSGRPPKEPGVQGGFVANDGAPVASWGLCGATGEPFIHVKDIERFERVAAQVGIIPAKVAALWRDAGASRGA